MVPAVALLISAVIWGEATPRRLDMLALAIFFALLGAGLMGIQRMFHGSQPYGFIGGMILFLSGFSVMVFKPKRLFGRVATALIAVTVSLMVMELVVVKQIGQSYDIRKAAAIINQYESQGLPIAHTGKYHGEFHFLGRLDKPFEIISERGINSWLEKHPNGRVITYFDQPPACVNSYKWRLLYSQSYRGSTMVIIARDHSRKR